MFSILFSESTVLKIWSNDNIFLLLQPKYCGNKYRTKSEPHDRIIDLYIYIYFVTQYFT